MRDVPNQQGTKREVPEKLIIENHTMLPMHEVLAYIRYVVGSGRISNNNQQYCYMTTFKDGCCVVSFLNAKSDRLVFDYDERYRVDGSTDK